MLQNDMKKGQMGILKNGWKFRIEDNKRGNIRMATVWGLYTEMGSIYTSDIDFVVVGGKLERLEQTSSQRKKAQKTAALMKSIFG